MFVRLPINIDTANNSNIYMVYDVNSCYQKSLITMRMWGGVHASLCMTQLVAKVCILHCSGHLKWTQPSCYIVRRPLRVLIYVLIYVTLRLNVTSLKRFNFRSNVLKCSNPRYIFKMFHFTLRYVLTLCL